MVVGLARQFAVSIARFQNGLAQGNARRDAVGVHLANGNGRKGLNVHFSRIPLLS